MLETVVLFERITKVEQQRRILTTEDKLNLLRGGPTCLNN